MKYFLTFLFLLIINFGNAQTLKDTSFTTLSEYKKQAKKFPKAKIVVRKQNKKVLEQKNVVYDTIEKRFLHFDAYLVKSKKALPAIIILHGGGWKSGSKEMEQPLAHALSNFGYNCFTIEYRLSDEAKYPTAIDDVLNAIEYIKKNAVNYNIDTSKIAILGCSSGAQMASLIGTKHPKSVHAIINIDGILAFHHPESQEGKMASDWLGGTYHEIPEVWDEASPLHHVSKDTPPILFVNSQFVRFHAGRDDMIKKLNSYGIYSKIEKITNSPHTFWLFDPWFEPTVIYIKQFLDKQLK